MKLVDGKGVWIWTFKTGIHFKASTDDADALKAIIYHSSLIIELFLQNFGLPHVLLLWGSHKLYFITGLLAP